jgi:hypothetical protein
MTPANLEGCWHDCCLLTTVHEHDVAPERCDDCAEVRPLKPSGKSLTERALGIAASKHNPRSEP